MKHATNKQITKSHTLVPVLITFAIIIRLATMIIKEDDHLPCLDNPREQAWRRIPYIATTSWHCDDFFV